MNNNGNLTCTCINNFSGLQCNFNISACSTACKNGGTCSISFSNQAGYTCSCPIGYTGNSCESK